MSGIEPEPLLEVKRLCIEIPTAAGVVRPANGVDLTIGVGEIVALVGETGSGKSMTAASILGMVPSQARIASGQILFQGRDLARSTEQDLRTIRGAQLSLVPQNARLALNPMLTIERQLRNVLRRHLGLSRAGALERSTALLESVGFADPRRVLRSYPHQLSGGMVQRVVIAMALGMRPRLVIADEPTTGLDATVQVEVLDLLMSAVTELGAGALLITHDLGVAAHYADRILVMHAGQIVEDCPTASFFRSPCHPYGIALVASLEANPPAELMQFISRADPVTSTPEPNSCKYAPRCPLADELCRSTMPQLDPVGIDHQVRCHFATRARLATQGAFDHG